MPKADIAKFTQTLSLGAAIEVLLDLPSHIAQLLIKKAPLEIDSFYLFFLTRSKSSNFNRKYVRKGRTESYLLAARSHTTGYFIA